MGGHIHSIASGEESLPRIKDLTTKSILAGSLWRLRVPRVTDSEYAQMLDKQIGDLAYFTENVPGSSGPGLGVFDGSNWKKL